MTTWTAPPAHRVSEPETGPERAMLQGWLDWHRQTLLSKCTGLTAEQLRTASAPPSSHAPTPLYASCARFRTVAR